MFKECKLIGFDLMDTLIVPPSREKIIKWIDNIQKKHMLSSLQKELFAIGFPYSMFVDDLKSFEVLKGKMLISKDDNELRNESINKYSITKDYANFVIEESIFSIGYIHNLKKIRNMNKQLLIISNLYPIYVDIINKFNLHDLFDEIILSCTCNIAKPNPEIFGIAFAQNKESIFIGDNYISDIMPLISTKIRPFFYTKSKLILFIKRNGITGLIEKEEKDYYIINNTAHIHLKNLGILAPSKNNYISKTSILRTENSYKLKELDEIDIIDNLDEIIGTIVKGGSI